MTLNSLMATLKISAASDWPQITTNPRLLVKVVGLNLSHRFSVRAAASGDIRLVLCWTMSSSPIISEDTLQSALLCSVCAPLDHNPDCLVTFSSQSPLAAPPPPDISLGYFGTCNTRTPGDWGHQAVLWVDGDIPIILVGQAGTYSILASCFPNLTLISLWCPHNLCLWCLLVLLLVQHAMLTHGVTCSMWMWPVQGARDCETSGRPTVRVVDWVVSRGASWAEILFNIDSRTVLLFWKSTFCEWHLMLKCCVCCAQSRHFVFNLIH